jgi:hypothetical protein
MNRFIAKLASQLDAKLGRCPRCMRQSFLAALAAWAVAGIAWAIFGSNIVAAAAIIVALGLNALWIAHLIAHATRSVAASGAQRSERAAAMSRREIIPAFARALGAMALVTAWPAGAAFAANCCDCSQCRSDQVCCNTANGCCGCFPGSIRCPSR